MKKERKKDFSKSCLSAVDDCVKLTLQLIKPVHWQAVGYRRDTQAEQRKKPSPEQAVIKPPKPATDWGTPKRPQPHSPANRERDCRKPLRSDDGQSGEKIKCRDKIYVSTWKLMGPEKM